MERILLKSKIHSATVTKAELHYMGSIGIDASLLDAAEIVEYEQVHIYNITNGERLVTYAIRCEPGSGEIQINGAAAHLAKPGDKIIIASFANYTEEEVSRHRARVLLMGENNVPLEAHEVTH